MNLEALRQIIRSSVQQGTPTLALATAEPTRLLLAETSALRAWERRLRIAGNDLAAIKPPVKGLNWF